MIIPMESWAEKNMGLFDFAGKAWFGAGPFEFSTIFIMRNTMGNEIRGGSSHRKINPEKN